MSKQPRRQATPHSPSLKAARALQRAIRKDNPAKEPPTVGKPVIVDPAEPSVGSIRGKRQTKRKESRKDQP
jgi:hypothetical protein